MSTLIKPLQIKWNVIQKKWSFSTTLLYNKGMLYVLVGDDELWAIGGESGEVKWKLGNLEDNFSMTSNVGFADNYAFVLHKDDCFVMDCQRGKKLKAFKLGKSKWRHHLPAFGDGASYLSTWEDYYPFLSEFDVKTGALLWRFPLKAKEREVKNSRTFNFTRAVSSPVLVDDAMCIACQTEYGVLDGPSKGDQVGVNLVFCLDVKSGKEKWQFTQDCNSCSQYLGSYRKNVYFIDGNNYQLFVLDAITGREKGSFSLNSQSNMATDPPVFAGEMLYIFARDNIYALDADNCQEVWHKQADSNWSKPSVYESLVYFPSESKRCLNAVDGKTGQQKWTFTPRYPKRDGVLNGWFDWKPVLTNDVLCLICGNNSVYALDALSGEIKGEFLTENAVGSLAADKQLIYFLSGNISPIWKQLSALSYA